MMSLSESTALLLFGMISGAVVSVGLEFLMKPLLRCRFGWHAWGRWSLTGTGNGQARTCSKCGLMDVKLFNGYTVSIAQPAAATLTPEGSTSGG
jgi:hypothetical protein